jgi:ferritin-like metal-binding protein YciE
MQQMNSMQDLIQNMLEGLYSGEQEALQALPKLAEHCQTPELKKLLQDHEQHTQQQCERLEEIFDQIGMKAPKKAHNAVIAALAKECEQMIRSGGDDKVLEAALIMGAQKMEHIEIAGYGTAVEMARMMGQKKLAKLLGDSLEEEEKTDKKLTKVARKSVNPQAKQRSA